MAGRTSVVRPSVRTRKRLTLSKKADREGLSLAYRIGYRVRWILFTFYGPPRLDARQDPLTRLKKEREAKVAAARAAREEREARGGGAGR